MPNPSLERTSTGLALGPRTGQCHHPLRGPSTNPVGSAQLKRYASLPALCELEVSTRRRHGAQATLLPPFRFGA